MPETLRNIIMSRRDFAWLLEIVLSAAAWVILRCGAPVRPKRGRIAFEFLALTAVLSAVNLLCLELSLLIPGHFFAPLWALMQGLVAYLYLEITLACPRKTKLLLWLALHTSSLCLMSMAGLSSILVGRFLSRGVAEAAARFVFYLLIPVVALFLRRFSLDEYSLVPATGIRMLFFGTVCAMLLHIIEALFFMQSDAVTIVMLCSYFCMFTMSCSALQSMHTLGLEQSALLELQTEKQRFEAEREMTRMTEKNLDDLRCIRHDLKNQYSYMQILLLEKRYDELQRYFEQLSENLPAPLNMIDCGNRTMNTVLNMELSKLKSDRIDFEHQLVVPPVLPFPDEDICAIITNLLDNADDECRRLLEKGWTAVRVRLEIYPHHSYLFIKCSNSTDRTELTHAKGGLHTTKQDEQMHGYGTRIIARLAEKHNGCADYSLSGGQFVAQIMLDMTEDTKGEN